MGVVVFCLVILVILAMLFGESSQGNANTKTNTKTNARARAPFQIGDRVVVKYSGLEGTIIDKNGNTYMVGFANGKGAESYSASELKKTW